MTHNKETIKEYDKRRKGEWLIALGCFAFWAFSFVVCNLLGIGV